MVRRWSSSRLQAEQVSADATRVSEGKWTELSTFVRRSFHAFLMGAQEVTPGAIFRVSGNPRSDGSLVLIPFEDARSGRQYLARVTPSGAVWAEGVDQFELAAPVVIEVNPAEVELALVRAERASSPPAQVEDATASPLPDPEDAAESYSRSKFDQTMERNSCREGYLAGYAAVPRNCPRPESNQRTRFRKPLLYPLSYGGAGQRVAPSAGPLFIACLPALPLARGQVRRGRNACSWTTAPRLVGCPSWRLS